MRRNPSGVAVEVGVPRVPRGDPQRLLLAAAGDPQRDAAVLQRQWPADRPVDLVVLAVECGRARRPELVHDLHALVEHADAVARSGEPVAVGAPLVLVPARPDAHLGPPAGDHVHRRRDLRQVGGIAVPHAGAHLPEPHPAGGGGEPGHQRPRLVRRLLRGHRHGVEVVEDPDRLERPVLGRLRDAEHGRPVVRGVDACQIQPPALRHEESKSHTHHPKEGRRTVRTPWHVRAAAPWRARRPCGGLLREQLPTEGRRGGTVGLPRRMKSREMPGKHHQRLVAA